MSYCHTTSSGSLIDFHSIVVSNALTPEINGASCLTVCAFYGCSDPNATNYDPNATVDDGSCLYSHPVLTAVITTITCNGLSNGSIDLSVSGGLLPYTYSWSNGFVSQDLNNIPAGTYSLTVTDALGQVQTASYIVTEPATIIISYNSVSTSAPGLSDGAIYTTITGGVLPFSYYWVSPYDTTQNLLNIVAGTYTFYAIDANNCFSTAIIVVQDGAIFSGCTDATATNYNSLATVDDGSCTYNCNTAPTGLNVFDVIDTRVNFAWDNMNSTNCMVLKYYVRYREVGTTAWNTRAAGTGNGLCNFGLNTTDQMLLGLTASTTYEWKLKAFYCGGTSSYYSAPSTFTTADACPILANLAVQTYLGNHTKALFSWDSTGTYTYARVALRVDTVGSAWETVGGFGTFAPTMSQFKFGLVAGESYRAGVRAYCDANISSHRSIWSPFVFWTQPGTAIKLGGGSAINNLDIYPNPSRDIFNISFTSEDKQNLRVRILNVIGEELINENLEQFIGEYTKQINLSDNAKGIYFLEIETNEGIINKKLILQ